MKNKNQDLKIQGLTEKQVLENQKKYGLNEVISKNGYNPIKELALKFLSPISIILTFSSFFAYLFSEIREAIIIFSMVILSSFLDFFQEYRSNKAAKELSLKLHRKCTVIRDEIKQNIKITEVTVGDILFVSIGDILPADGIVLKSDNLSLNESALTGESFPEEKEEGFEILSGSEVVSGSGYVKVTKIGMQTSYGKIAESLNTKRSTNNYEKGIREFSFLILRITLIIISCIFIINISKSFILSQGITQEGIFQLILFSITIVVGLTPELLPVIMSVNMTQGALKMSKKGVLVKKLDSIPGFGSMNVLCTDKTGTLTENKITLEKHLDLNGNGNEEVFTFSHLNSYFQNGLQNPIDKAILEHQKNDNTKFKKIKELSYDFNRKRLSVVVEDENGQKWLITKGQFEGILSICQRFQEKGISKKIDENKINSVQKLYQKLSLDGYRVIAIAVKKLAKDEPIEGVELENNMQLLGFLAFVDPPKLEAKAAIPRLLSNGIEVKIITGDNEFVTQKICGDLKLKVTGWISGDDFEKLSLSKQKATALKNNLFVRFNPSQKMLVIKALKEAGKVVGYMGDGINDAPSLKASDVSISVENAVDVARESADIILLTKSFDSLLDGVLEGRKTFANTLKYMLMALSSNLGNMLSLIGAAIFLPFLPILPIQILLNNTLYDLSQLAIPTDNVDKEMLNQPKQWNFDFVKKFMLVFGPLNSAYDLFTFYLMFQVFNLRDSAFQTAWFLASFGAQVLVIYLLRTQKTPFLESSPSGWLVLNTLIILAIAFIIPYSMFNLAFSFVSLPLNLLATIVLIIIGDLAVVEIGKRWFYRFNKV